MAKERKFETDAPVISSSSVYIPTIESCWEFGIQRNPRNLIPILDSLTPYKFLRGVQFDTKVFQLSELLGILGVFDSNINNDIILRTNTELDGLRAALNVKYPFPYISYVTYPPSATIGYKSLINQPTIDTIMGLAKTAYQILDIKFNILPNWQESMPAITISHDWGAGDDILTNFMNSVNNIVKNVSEFGRSIGEVSASVPFIKDRYKSSKMTEITVPILLFTKDNFTRDIFKPLMLLIFFSSARSNPDTLSKFKGIYESINEQIKQKLTESTSDQTTQTLTDLKDAVVSGIDQINRMVGTKSITVLPPPTFKVYTRNKTINMSRAAITSVSYQFKGPYIKAGYKGLFGQLFGSSGLGPNIGDSLDRLLRDEYVKIFNFKEESFPSICEINITLKETDFIDGDEYYKNLMSDSYIEILKSDKAETLLSTQIASGIAQNIGVVLPETRGTGDLLGGGKWVPPGESLSGIPGFL